jgi:hypothetical protein
LRDIEQLKGAAALSYDLTVFDADVAPRGRAAFMAWYDQQTQWTESHGYNDPRCRPHRFDHGFRT